MTTRLRGRPAADAVRHEVAARVAAEQEKFGRAPGLAVVLVGEDPASQIYVKRKHEAAVAAGMNSFEYRLPAGAATSDVLDVVDQLNQDPAIHGILVQFPLPSQVDGETVIGRIEAAKDVDGLTRTSQGALLQNRPGLRPCTAVGILDLLSFYRIPVAGKRAVVVGRSALVGRPAAVLLMHANATVTVVHSQTVEASKISRQADILVVAAGRPGLVTEDWIKSGATVVDVGIHRTEAGIVGDVLVEAADGRAEAFTPVPGGVGPMTIAELMRNTWLAFQSQVAG